MSALPNIDLDNLTPEAVPRCSITPGRHERQQRKSGRTTQSLSLLAKKWAATLLRSTSWADFSPGCTAAISADAQLAVLLRQATGDPLRRDRSFTFQSHRQVKRYRSVGVQAELGYSAGTDSV